MKQVFLPAVSFCCGNPIKLAAAGTDAKLFTRLGTRSAKVYTGWFVVYTVGVAILESY